MRKILFITLFTIIASFAASGQNKKSGTNSQKADSEATAQQDTTKKVDIYKEFDLITFEDAKIKIKDSSVLTQHLIGVKGAYGISNVTFSLDIDHKAFTTPKNFGVYYTYYHSLWKSMPYFGLQTGVEYNEMGYTHLREIEKDVFEEQKQVYQSIQIPLLSQFRVDFWKMRVMVGIGPYGYYLISSDLEGGIPETTNKYGVGIMGTAGFAFVLHPVEFHLEAGYKYGLSYFCDPKIYSTETWVYTNANQLLINLGIFFRLGR